MNPTGHDPAVLLRVDRRLRALARELLRDSGEAEDLAQETWVAALESGPIHSLPAWVATVVRRLALDRRRVSRRRDLREAEAARPESSPAAVEILEREEARRRVVEALLALDEPLRTTLILRFLEELPPRAVAARMDVPVETVRSRTRRGLEVLRERLDRSFGDRTSWCSALLPILRSPSAAEALSTALVVMSIPKKLALVVLVCALGWLAWPRRAGSAEPVVALGSGAPAVLQEPQQEGAADLVPAGEPAARATLPSVTGDRPHAQEPFGSLRVRVTWFDGTPAQAIAVYARQHDSENPELEQREGMTDEAGNLFFTRVPVGSTSVVLDRGMWASTEVEAGREKELTLLIPRGFDLNGVVEDLEGHRIAAAEVWLSRSILVGGTLVARTRADGSFFLRSLPCDQTPIVAACASGFRPPKPEDADGKEGDVVNLRLVLHRGAGEVVGTVIDSLTGAPLPGAFVGVGPRTSMGFSGEGFTFSLSDWSRRARTDDGGRFRVNGIKPGSCCVAVRTPGHSLWRQEIDVREDRTETVAVALLPEAALEGHVVDERGRPLSGLFVLVGQGVEWLRASAQTGPDGSFHIGALEANATLEARVMGKEVRLASTSFLALPGQTFVWEAQLGQMGFIRGRVLDEASNPLAGWSVHLFDSVDGTGGSATTDPQGSFRFEGLDPNEHSLMVFDPAVMREYSGTFAALKVSGVRPSADEIVLRVPGSSTPSVRILGVFLDEQGQPMPGAEVMPWHGGGNSSGLKCEEATGRFELGPFPPGRWRLNLRAPGRATVFLGPRELAPGETWDCGEVRLAPVGRVVARLQPGGIELGEDLKLRIRQGGWWRSEGLDGDGLLRSASLPPGHYEIDVLGGSYDEVAVPFEIRSGEETLVDVPIRAGHLATVRVKLADPSVSRVELCLTTKGNPFALSRTVGRSKDGDFLEGFHLAPGTYGVEASAPGRHAKGQLVVEPVDRDGNVLELVLD